MSRIEKVLAKQKPEGRKGFIPFVTAGDPEIDTSLEIISMLASFGADVIELGVPFSDPMADGPTIQRSSQRALEKGVDLNSVLNLVERFRKTYDTPIVLFSYLNPLLRFGLKELANTASNIGVDGLLVTDAIDEEAKEIRETLAAKDIDLISLIAPTTTDERLKTICENASGFIYAVSRAGVTGTRTEMSQTAETLVKRARAFTSLPIAVGFGISTREHIQDVWSYADAAIVGSAIVAEIERSEAGNVVNNVENILSGLLDKKA